MNLKNNKITFVSPAIFTDWYWETPYIEGIGGSETHHIAMSYGLSKKGFDVLNYAPVPPQFNRVTHDGVEWRDCRKETGFEREGLWILARSFIRLPYLKNDSKIKQKIWIMAYDFNLLGEWTKEAEEKVDRLICMSDIHKQMFQALFPNIKDKIYAIRGGVPSPLFTQLHQQGIKRNLKSLIWPSSPDRGLINLIPIFLKAQEYIPDLELNIYYGMDHFEPQKEKRELRKVYECIEKYKNTRGINYLGRRPKMDLYSAFLKNALFVYPTLFYEVCCIAIMEAQALGCIPVVNPVFALAENTHHGVFLPGDPTDPLMRARYVETILGLVTNPAQQETIRRSMVPDALARFNWDGAVDIWSEWAKEDLSD